ncbi:MAG: RpoL/Rpb11 RNA polymerase subunit family protein [Candidatus Nanohaloarchaea archaeon]
MQIETFEKEDRLIVDMKQNHTLGNLLRKAVWKEEGEAAYDTGHPLGDESNLIVEDDNPVDTLKEAADQAKQWMTDIEGEV